MVKFASKLIFGTAKTDLREDIIFDGCGRSGRSG